MKVLKKILKALLVTLLAVIFVASLLVIILSAQQKNKEGNAGIFGYTFEVVQSDSMSGENGFEVGDIVIGKIIDADTVIEVGDIISYYTLVNKQEIVKTHRVSKTWEEGTFGTVYQTWGDNRISCPTPDSGFVARDEIISLYTGKIVGVGKLLMALKTPAGYLAMAIPIAAYIIYELFMLISIFMSNKKEQMKEQLLEETQEAKDAIIREYLAEQQRLNAENARKQAENDEAVQKGKKDD